MYRLAGLGIVNPLTVKVGFPSSQRFVVSMTHAVAPQHAFIGNLALPRHGFYPPESKPLLVTEIGAAILPISPRQINSDGV